MKVRLLADEDLDRDIILGVHRRTSGLDFAEVQKLGLRGIPDPESPEIAFLQGRIPVSHDRRTMTRHFAERISAGEHSPGAFIVAQDDRKGEVINALVLIGIASEASEWIDTIHFLPL